MSGGPETPASSEPTAGRVGDHASAEAARTGASSTDAASTDAGSTHTVDAEFASAELARAESLIREIPDYPSEGVLFRDIMPLIADGAAFRATVDALIAPFVGTFDVVAGLEARGFLFASAAAYATGAGLMPIRKAGKLPQPAASVDYALEYGNAVVEAHADFPHGSRVLVIDDVLATGGTLVASHELLRHLGYEAVGTAVLFEIADLGGRSALGDPALHTVFSS